MLRDAIQGRLLRDAIQGSSSVEHIVSLDRPNPVIVEVKTGLATLIPLNKRAVKPSR